MILCGPFCFYQDYVTFIDGSNYTRAAASAPTTAYVCVYVVCQLTDMTSYLTVK